MAPPAFTTDLSGDDDEDEPSPFAKSSRKKIGIIAGAVGAVLFIGIVFVSVSGGSAEPAKASAAGRVDPAAAAPLPPVPPVAVQAPAPTPSASVNLPPPPTTGAAVSAKPPPPRPAVAAKPRAAAPSGPKMIKVQSGGVAAR